MPTTRASITSVNAEGWTVEDSSPITYNPTGSPDYVVVQRPGFDATGTATTVTDNLLIMARKRQPYPSQASMTANTAVLSDEVYAADTVTGVTNNSTLVAPAPVCGWVTPDLERTRTSTMTVRLAVAHAHARNGSPVAAVKFITTDGTNTVNTLVSAMSSRQFASGLYAPYFEAAINTSTLNAGAICTVDAIVYPWVGAAYQISVSGATYPSMNLTTLKFLNDRTGSYGEAYAYVDPAGNNGTGVVSATAATAAANPYLTIAAASAAIKTFNTSNYTRSESAGGTIRLNVGTYTHSDFSTATANAFPLVIEATTPANKATTIYQDAGANTFGQHPNKLWLRNITLKRTANNIVFYNNNSSMNSANMLKLENVTINENGFTDTGAWIYDTGRLYLYEVDCATNIASLARYSTTTKPAHAIGCSGPWGTSGSTNIVYTCVASKLAGVSRVTGTAGMPNGDGQFIGFNFFSQPTNGSTVVDADGTLALGAAGFAMVCNVLEQYGGTTQPALDLWSAGTGACQNVLQIGNTVMGARSNVIYNSVSGETPVRRGRSRFNIEYNHNVKSDVFAAASANVNNWPYRYHVGSRANAYLTGSLNTSTPDATCWIGEVTAIGDLYGSTATRLTLAFTSDKSSVGSGGAGGGAGDYKPTTPSQVPKIPAGLAPYPIDMNGVTVANDGTGLSGAIQIPASASSTGTISGSGVFAAMSASGGSAAGVSVLAGASATRAAIIGASTIAGRGAANGAVVGPGVLAGTGASTGGSTGSSVVVGRSALISAMAGAAALVGLPASAAGIVGASTLAARSASISAASGASVLAGIAAGGGSIGSIVGQGSLSGLSAAIGANQGQVVLAGASAGLSGVLGASALAGLGASPAALVGGSILLGIGSGGAVNIDTPDVARPGAYRRITAPGTYRLITRPGHWRAAN